MAYQFRYVAGQEGSTDLDTNHRYTRRAYVLSDSRLDSTGAILALAAVPKEGDAYAVYAYDPATGTYPTAGLGGPIAPLFSDTDSVCVSRDAKQSEDDPRYWSLTLEYDGRQSVTAEPADVDWGDTPYQEYQVQDIRGRLFANSAGEPFAGGLPVERNRRTLTTVKNVPTWDPVATDAYNLSLNQSPFLAGVHPPGFPAGTCRLTSLAARRVRRVGYTGFYWQRKAVVDVDTTRVALDPTQPNLLEYRRWRKIAVDAGYKELRDIPIPGSSPPLTKKVLTPIQPGGAPTVEPHLLDGKGRRLVASMETPPPLLAGDPTTPGGPTGVPDVFVGTKGNPISGNVLANDLGSPTGAGLATGPGAALAFNGDGSFTYTPADANFTGYVSFTYQATNGVGSSGSTTVLLAIGVVLPVYLAFDVYETADWTGLGLEY